MKKVLFSLAALALVIGMVGAGTFAYFSDTETSNGNTFAAGTLDLKVGGKDDPIAAQITISNMKPGDTGSKTVALANAGTVNGTVKLHIKNVTNSEGDNTSESETDKVEPGDLGAALLVTIKYDANGDSDYDDEGETIVDAVALNTLNSVTKTLGALNATQTRNCEISWQLPSTTGNGVQGDIVTFDIEFTLVQ